MTMPQPGAAAPPTNDVPNGPAANQGADDLTTTQATPEEQAQKEHFIAVALKLIYSDQMFPRVLAILQGGEGTKYDPAAAEPETPAEQGTEPGEETPAEDPGTGGAPQSGAPSAGSGAAPAAAPGAPPPEGGGGGGSPLHGPAEGLARATVMVIGRVGSLAEQAGEKLQGDVVLEAGTEIFEDLANLSKEAGIKDYSQDSDAMWGAYLRAVDLFRKQLEASGEIDKQAAGADLEKLVRLDQNGRLEQIMRDLAAGDSTDHQAMAEKALSKTKGKEPATKGGFSALTQEG